MFFVWIVLPLLAVVLTAVFLYWKIYKGIQYFTGTRLKRGMQRLAAAAGMAVLVLPAFRFYGTWFLVLLHFLLGIVGFLFVLDFPLRKPSLKMTLVLIGAVAATVAIIYSCTRFRLPKMDDETNLITEELIGELHETENP